LVIIFKSYSPTPLYIRQLPVTKYLRHKYRYKFGEIYFSSLLGMSSSCIAVLYTLFVYFPLAMMHYFVLCYYFPVVTCATLPEVGPHVIMKGTSVTFGSDLTFTCTDGYQLNGSSVSTCNGTWNATDVECDGNVFLSMCDPYFDTSSKC
jgi:hypothetical protein